MSALSAAHPLVLVGALVVYSVGRLLDAGEVCSVYNRIHIRNLQTAIKAGEQLHQQNAASHATCTTRCLDPLLQLDRSQKHSHWTLQQPGIHMHLAGKGAQHIQQGEDDEGDVPLGRGVPCA